MTQLLAIAHVIKIIFIVICIITAYYWIKALIAAKRCDFVIDDIDDNKKFQYEINNALTLYKLLGCEKPDYVWTPDSISHLAAEAFEIKLLCICDKDIDKDNERGRQIKIILDNFNSLQDIIDKCDKYCSDKNAQFYFVPKVLYDGRELERINYKKYLSGGSKLYLEIQEEKQKKLDEQNKNGQKKKRK